MLFKRALELSSAPSQNRVVPRKGICVVGLTLTQALKVLEQADAPRVDRNGALLPRQVVVGRFNGIPCCGVVDATSPAAAAYYFTQHQPRHVCEASFPLQWLIVALKTFTRHAKIDDRVRTRAELQLQRHAIWQLQDLFERSGCSKAIRVLSGVERSELVERLNGLTTLERNHVQALMDLGLDPEADTPLYSRPVHTSAEELIRYLRATPATRLRVFDDIVHHHLTDLACWAVSPKRMFDLYAFVKFITTKIRGTASNVGIPLLEAVIRLLGSVIGTFGTQIVSFVEARLTPTQKPWIRRAAGSIYLAALGGVAMHPLSDISAASPWVAMMITFSMLESATAIREKTVRYANSPVLAADAAIRKACLTVHADSLRSPVLQSSLIRLYRRHGGRAEIAWRLAHRIEQYRSSPDSTDISISEIYWTLNLQDADLDPYRHLNFAQRISFLTRLQPGQVEVSAGFVASRHDGGNLLQHMKQYIKALIISAGLLVVNKLNTAFQSDAALKARLNPLGTVCHAIDLETNSASASPGPSL